MRKGSKRGVEFAHGNCDIISRASARVNQGCLAVSENLRFCSRSPASDLSRATSPAKVRARDSLIETFPMSAEWLGWDARIT